MISSNFKAARSQLDHGFVDVKMAKALSVREVFSWLKCRHATNVVLEVDALSVVQALKGQTIYIYSLVSIGKERVMV